MIRVRPGEPADAVALSALYQQEGWLTFNDKVNQLMTHSAYLVLVADETVIGFVRYLTNQLVTTFVCECLVSETYRGKGYGSLLLDELQAAYPTTRLELISQADSFYDNNRFRVVGTGFRRP
ncbi:N-acetyltransferase family protein [Streptococcus entericus]|uniref:GNAT family N-acetyltransferase n=1 Tax=Streptococcus entericus TaxID=155680 RepID=UPI0003822973|nr:GNAT family N-acetyltransferase [Streptococcus entericus]